MTIRQLEVFKTVCEELSFSKAARRLYMTQPAVSHVIQDLEKEAGTTLLERSNQKIRLNERGRLLLQKAVRLLELYRELQEEMDGLDAKGGIRVGSSITIANFWLPSFVKQFEAAYPAAPLQITVESAVDTAKKLEQGEIDIALVEGALYIGAFEKYTFSSYEIIPLCSPAYLNAFGQSRPGSAAAGTGGLDGREFSLEEFLTMKLLLREKGSAVRDVLEGMVSQNGMEIKPCWTSVNSQALLQAAAAGLGTTVLPGILARRELEKGELLRLKVKDMKLVNKNYIAFHKSGYMTEPMKRFIEIVTKSD